jgi:hypothetical protein
VEVRNTNFGRDAEALANKVGEALKGARPATGRWPFLASGAAWLMVPGRCRTVAGTAMALLLVGWIGLYQVGVSVWVPWAEQPDPARADKAKAAADAEAQRKATEAELQRMKDEVERQSKAAADAEAKLKAAEAEQQRLKEEQQRQAKAAADAEAKRKAAEAEQQRLAAVRAEEERRAKTGAEAAARSAAPSQPAAAATKGLFEIRSNMMAATKFPVADFLGVVSSVDECELRCKQSASCNVFAFAKRTRACYLYSRAELVPNDEFDSGVRNSAAR